MKNNTLDTALISLGAGCLVIGIFEVITRGLSFAYVWLMLSIVLWLAYTIRKRKRLQEGGSAEEKTTITKSGGASTKRSAASKSRRKRK